MTVRHFFMPHFLPRFSLSFVEALVETETKDSFAFVTAG